MLFKNKNYSVSLEDKIKNLIEIGQEKVANYDKNINMGALFAGVSAGVGILGALGAAKIGVATVPLIAGATVGSAFLTAGFAVGIIAAGYSCFNGVLKEYQENKVNKRIKELENLNKNPKIQNDPKPIEKIRIK